MHLYCIINYKALYILTNTVYGMEEKVYLSDMERRLLRFLMLSGAHHSVHEIGRQLRVSPQTVAYKMKQLEENGVIRSYRYRANPYKLGFTNMTWLALDVSKHLDMEGLEDKILSHPNIFSVSVLAGQIDIFAKVFYSEHDELTEIVEWLGLNFKDVISRISLVPVMRVEKLNQIHGLDRELSALDEKSISILNYQLSHPKASLKETSEALGFHRNTVSRKWTGMWKQGVLLKKSVFVSPEVYQELGFGISSCVFIDAIPGRREEIVKEIVKMESVHELYSLAFRHDLLAVTRTSDINHCYAKVRELYSTRHIADTESMVILSSKEKDVAPLTVHE